METIVDQLESEHSVEFDDPLTNQEIADIEKNLYSTTREINFTVKTNHETC